MRNDIRLSARALMFALGDVAAVAWIVAWGAFAFIGYQTSERGCGQNSADRVHMAFSRQAFPRNGVRLARPDGTPWNGMTVSAEVAECFPQGGRGDVFRLPEGVEPWQLQHNLNWVSLRNRSWFVRARWAAEKQAGDYPFKSGSWPCVERVLERYYANAEVSPVPRDPRCTGELATALGLWLIIGAPAAVILFNSWRRTGAHSK